ncbi:hypothetical protein FB45DRAFT_1053045 [Roridomyces roridus]|uniref:BTB domain-containing protein n=1 Tax=Roridomyces roridus TaxID=1738132 RepID=A0AAD7FX87_9AGAR|nr:hypothetical protein FB45DRAFT_1053045 [Roridomyces roridus]
MATVTDVPYDDPNAQISCFALLSLVSPVFKDMLAMPQPEHATTESHPVIPVAEDSETLRLILSWCDPRLSPALDTDTLQDIQTVLHTADKYCMESVTKRVGDILSYGIRDLCPAGMGSLRVYAIAMRYRLETVAKKAARCSLEAKWEDLMSEDIPELDHIPASALHRLQQYRVACGVVGAKKAAVDWSWIQDATGVVSGCPKCASGLPPRHWSRWWTQFMSIAAEELARNPSAATITHELAIISSEYLGSCADCGRTQGETYRSLMRFNKAFTKEIERTVGEVPFVPFP